MQNLVPALNKFINPAYFAGKFDGYFWLKSWQHCLLLFFVMDFEELNLLTLLRKKIQRSSQFCTHWHHFFSRKWKGKGE